MKKKIFTLFVTGIFAMGLLAGCGATTDDSTAETKTDDKNTSGVTVTVSINCSTILDNMDQLDSAKAEFVPEDGWILEPVEVEIEAGDSVYDVLLAVCQENKISMEHNTTPGYQSEYIEGIGQLYEFDCGELSGWQFSVDGETQSYGSDKVLLEGGETIEWLYTCDLGRDIGTAVEE